jgi:hypothetical protein
MEYSFFYLHTCAQKDFSLIYHQLREAISNAAPLNHFDTRPDCHSWHRRRFSMVKILLDVELPIEQSFL